MGYDDCIASGVDEGELTEVEDCPPDAGADDCHAAMMQHRVDLAKLSHKDTARNVPENVPSNYVTRFCACMAMGQQRLINCAI